MKHLVVDYVNVGQNILIMHEEEFNIVELEFIVVDLE